MFATRYWTLAVLLAVAAVSGSGPRAVAADEIAPVKGVVTLNGKPLAGARVIFHQTDGQFVGCKTDKDGKYKVDRVPVGKHKVTVEYKGAPERYSSEEKSPLEAEVKKGGTTEYNLDIKIK
jgi:hypothetical protein